MLCLFLTAPAPFSASLPCIHPSRVISNRPKSDCSKNWPGIFRSRINAMQEKSERKKAEESLRETTNYFNNLFDYANAPIIVWDPQLNITRFNHAFERLTGIKSSEVLGKPLDILFPEDSKAESFATSTGQPPVNAGKSSKSIFKVKTGKHIPCCGTPRHYLTPTAKNMIATIAQGQDITERKKAEEEVRKLNEELKRRAAELEASNKELEAFSYSVSHDLRAPLRSITGFSSILLEDYQEKLDDEGKLYLKKIRDSGELMGQLIDDLLKLSRVTRSDIYYEKVNLTDIAQNVIDELAKSEPKRKVKVNHGSGYDRLLRPELITPGDAESAGECVEVQQQNRRGANRNGEPLLTTANRLTLFVITASASI